MTDERMQCPCCGNPVADADGLAAVIATLRPLARRILLAIRETPGITTEQIGKIAYRRRSKPTDPANSIRVAISDARPALEAAGWTVKGTKSQGYRISPMESAGGPE